MASLPLPAGESLRLDNRDVVSPDGLPQGHQRRAAHRGQRDPGGRGVRGWSMTGARWRSAGAAGRGGQAMTMRLGRQPGEVIDRGRELTFSWNGRPFPAYAGDTIVSALAAAGERVFSRSMK